MDILTAIRTETALVLGIKAEDLAEFENLFDLGLDSILVVQLAMRLRTKHNLHLTPEIAFRHPTIASLAEALRSPQGDAYAG